MFICTFAVCREDVQLRLCSLFVLELQGRRYGISLKLGCMKISQPYFCGQCSYSNASTFPFNIFYYDIQYNDLTLNGTCLPGISLHVYRHTDSFIGRDSADDVANF
jgi:hypothetical protein